MPYRIKTKDGKFCVMKKAAPGGQDEEMKCYTDKGEATKYMRALYAHVETSMKVHLTNLESPSVSDRLQAISNAFHTGSDPNPNPRDCYIKDVYDDYILVTDGKNIYKVGYTIDDSMNVTFDAPDKWKLQKYTDAQVGIMVYTELQGTMGVFDGLAASHDVAFVSMSGEELFVEPSDLSDYMANGQAVIESTRTSTGDVIGLPIDMNGHDHKGGAGWIKGFELDSPRNIVKFLVEWTEDGAELIRKNLRRFFSPSVDPINKVILGGSLTNWPATRNSKGQLLLQPIELSNHMEGITMLTLEELATRLEAAEATITSLKPKPPVAPPASPEAGDEPIGLELEGLLQNDDAIDHLGELATNKAKELVRVAQRKSHVVEFVSKVVGGTSDHPVGLPIRATELTKLLLSLPEKQSLAVERLLAKVWDAAIDFSEHGIATGSEFSMLKAVPAAYVELLRDWVKAGNTAKSFFDINPEAGIASDYNLTMFNHKESE